MQNRKITLILLVILITLTWSSCVLARETEREYPFGGPTTTTGITPGQYVSYIYKAAVIIAGLVGFGAFIYGGVLYLTSTGSPQMVTKAKRQMLGGVLGMVIILAGHIILSTFFINPSPDLKPVKPNRGVCFYTKDKKDFYCFQGQFKSLPGTTTVRSVEFRSPPEELKRIYLFNKEDYKGGIGSNPIENEERFSEVDLGASYTPKSLFLEWSNPGVYLYPNTGFKGDFPGEPFKLYRANVSNLENYNDRVKSLQFKSKGTIKNGSKEEPEHRYGSVLHSRTGYKGECSIVFGEFKTAGSSDSTSTDYWISEGISDLSSGGGDNYIHSIGYGIRSLTFFEYSYEAKKAGGGVTFYDQTDLSGNSAEITNEEINNSLNGERCWRQNINYGSGEFKDLDKILSFKVDGYYMIVLTLNKNLDGRCQIFHSNKKTLAGSYVLPDWQVDKISSVAIIPLK